MRTLNFFGVASALLPKVATSITAAQTNTSYANNDIYFFDGSIPSYDILASVDSKTKLLSDFTEQLVCKYESITLDYSYDASNLRRTIKKPIDVLEGTFLKDTSEITWFAVILNEQTPEAGKNPILFSNSISAIEDDNKFATLAALSGSIGSEQLLREFSIILTEKSQFEV